MVERSIAIIYPSPEMAVTPSLTATVQVLAETGYDIDLYLCKPGHFPMPTFDSQRVRIFWFPDYRSNDLTVRKSRFFTLWLPYLLRKCWGKSYHYLMGVNAQGLVLARIVSWILNIPVVYFSLEVLVESELASPTMRLLKKLERKCNQSTVFTIIQDEDRAALLARENCIDQGQMIYLPNAPLGKANRTKTDFLHHRLGIENDRTIVLHAGSIHSGMMSLELAQAALTWPHDLAMVFQMRSAPITEYEKAFAAQIDGQHTYLSRIPVGAEELSKLVGSADIGLALYRRNGSEKNLYTMGRSSGKIAHYLQGGLPVVTMDFPSLRKYIETYGCGACVSTVAEVFPSICKIKSSYNEFSSGAIACFQEQFDFRSYIKQALWRLDQVLEMHPYSPKEGIDNDTQ